MISCPCSPLIVAMQPSEALGIAAQVAVTLAGFAGIVVVFRPDSVHRWSPLDKLRLQLLLTNSALPLAESLLGMLLLAFDPPPASIWRWCSGVSFSAQVLAFAYMRNPRRRLFTRADMQAVNKFLFYGIGSISTVAVASRRSTLRSGIASGLSSPSYSFSSSRPSRNLSAWFSCRHTSPVALNELFNLSCWSIRQGNPALIDELIDFLRLVRAEHL